MDNPTTENTERVGGSAPAPCSAERTHHRSVIERKLLTALEDGNTVAALFSKQDLKDIIAALYGYKLADRKVDLSWSEHDKRCKSLAEGMSQLLREAFPPNDKGQARRDHDHE